VHIEQRLCRLAIAAALVFGIFGPPPAAADELADVKARGSVICATYFAVPPFGFPDPASRQPVGFDVDMCSGIAKRLGVRMEHKSITVENRVSELVTARVDIVSALLPYTKDRAEVISFSDAVFDYATNVMVLASSEMTTLSDLAGKRVSMTRGTANERYMREKVPTAEVLTYQDASNSFLALQQGKAQGYATITFAGMRFINETDGKFRFMEESLHRDACALGLRKGETAFIQAVNAALADMEQSGEIDVLWAKWLGPETKYNVPRGRKLTPIAHVTN
jgi:polar amino acid transport system substrate-binding protein